ncbi:MAG: CHASE2 domain-containing protein, partial [Geminicoccaceae bacterium]
DLMFDREREAQHDRALSRSIAAARRVALFEVMDLERRPLLGTVERPLALLETQRIRQPIPSFAGAAAGLGPFPLPIVPARVSQVWLFNPGSGGRPTLPAVAVQLRAMGVYERWVALLKRAGANGVGAVARDGPPVSAAVDLRRLMMGFRAAFLADKTLGARVRSGIDEATRDAPSRRLLHALADLYDGPDSRYLNFYGPAGQIRTVSLVDMMDERPDPAAWQGHVVFVGQSEMHEPHDDAFITVYSRSDGVNIAGVEIAATTFANLLDDRFLLPSPYWLWVVVGFGLLIGVVAGLLPALWAVPACLAVGGLYLLGAELAFAKNAIWMPTTVPLLAELPLGLFAGLFLQYREAQRAKENLSKAIR